MVHLMTQSSRGRRLAAAAAAAVTLASVVAACSSSSGGSAATATSSCPAPGTINKSLSGTTLNFLMPPWGDMGKAEFQKFTDRTGITVNLQALPFDQVHDKTVASMAAGTPPADIMEVDSLWVGQYVAAGWLDPVAQYVAPKTLSTVSAKANFTINNKLYGMPWVVDFRWTAAANMTMLAKVGATTAPTWADIMTDAEKLKAKGIVKYPVAMELDVEATTAEPWLTLMVSAGGTLLDAQGKPTFTDPNSAGYKAAEFLRSLYAAGLINPGAVNLSGDEAIQEFASGQAAFGIPSGPGIISTETNAKTSKVANDHVVGLLAGPNGVATGAYGLPESLGIPSNAKNKCAAAMFLAWWNETPQEVFRYTQPSGGSFPAQQAAIDQVLATQKPEIAQSIKAVLPDIKPLFPNGAPTWYPSFANDMATTLQAVILGHTSVAAGMNTLANQAVALEKKS